jgi:hypothetical protein
LASLPRWTEPVEHALLVQLAKPAASYPQVVEVQAAELVSSQHAVLEAVHRDPPVTGGQPGRDAGREILAHPRGTPPRIGHINPLCRAT